MNRRRLLAAAGALAALVPPAALAVPNRRVGALVIHDPWARPSMPGAPNGAAYLTLQNTGARADRLIGGSGPACARVEVHEMSMAGGVMRKRPLTEGLPLPPHAEARLAPGSFHIMLIGLRRPLSAGTRITLSLRFERAGPVTLTLPVEVRPDAPNAHMGM